MRGVLELQVIGSPEIRNKARIPGDSGVEEDPIVHAPNDASVIPDAEGPLLAPCEGTIVPDPEERRVFPLEIVGRLAALPLDRIHVEVLVEGHGEPILTVLERLEANLRFAGDPEAPIELRPYSIVLVMVGGGEVAAWNRAALAISLQWKLADDLAVPDSTLEGQRTDSPPELYLLGEEGVDFEDDVPRVAALLDVGEEQVA